MADATTATNTFQAANSPPDTSRNVILRFDDDGQRDAVGFFWRPEGSWYLSAGGKSKRHAVHPVMWRELLGSKR